MAEDDWDFEDLGDDGVVDVDLADPAPWEGDTSAAADPISLSSAFATVASNSVMPDAIQPGGGGSQPDDWPSDGSGEWLDSGINPATGQGTCILFTAMDSSTNAPPCMLVAP